MTAVGKGEPGVSLSVREPVGSSDRWQWMFLLLLHSTTDSAFARYSQRRIFEAPAGSKDGSAQRKRSHGYAVEESHGLSQLSKSHMQRRWLQ